jgi:hypothetical protein
MIGIVLLTQGSIWVASQKACIASGLQNTRSDWLVDHLPLLFKAVTKQIPTISLSSWSQIPLKTHLSFYNANPK